MNPCGICGVEPGKFHLLGCSVERCGLCGYQKIACGCVYEVNGIDRETLEDDHPICQNGPTEAMYEKYDLEAAKYGGRLPWTGEYPGLDACREFDLWCRWVRPTTGELLDPTDLDGEMKRCGRHDEGAEEDLNRLRWAARWNKVERRWVRSS